MKVNLGLVFTDPQLRQINTALNYSSRPATRKAVRVWLQHVVQNALNGLPEAKKGRRKLSDPAPLPPESMTFSNKGEILRSNWATLNAAPPESICKNCSQSKEEHGKMGFLCPISKTYKKTTTFYPST